MGRNRWEQDSYQLETAQPRVRPETKVCVERFSLDPNAFRRVYRKMATLCLKLSIVVTKVLTRETNTKRKEITVSRRRDRRRERGA